MDAGSKNSLFHQLFSDAAEQWIQTTTSSSSAVENQDDGNDDNSDQYYYNDQEEEDDTPPPLKASTSEKVAQQRQEVDANTLITQVLHPEHHDSFLTTFEDGEDDDDDHYDHGNKNRLPPRTTKVLTQPPAPPREQERNTDVSEGNSQGGIDSNETESASPVLVGGEEEDRVHSYWNQEQQQLHIDTEEVSSPRPSVHSTRSTSDYYQDSLQSSTSSSISSADYLNLMTPTSWARSESHSQSFDNSSSSSHSSLSSHASVAAAECAASSFHDDDDDDGEEGDGTVQDWVYIHDRDLVWLPAKVLEYGAESAICVIEQAKDWESTTAEEATDKKKNKFQSANSLGDGKGLHPSMKDVSADAIRDLKERLNGDAGESVPDHLFRKVYYKDYEQGDLPLQNDRHKKLINMDGKRDLADLKELHPPAILYNLKRRHAQSKPYTRVGDIVIAMNPFQWFDELYSPTTRDFYSKHLIWDQKDDDQETQSDAGDVHQKQSMYDKLGFEPHAYEVSSLAYRGLATTRNDETIVVTGESGAGKTETVKILMDHLATVQKTRPGGISSDHSTAQQIVQRVCHASPVFEAFGNAKTIRNDNSSRFGKFVRLQFTIEPDGVAQQAGRTVPYTDLIGSHCDTYLLEKNRVVFHAEGERTYHIFYQLLAASPEFKKEVWPELAARSAQDFLYTADPALSQDNEDGKDWEETKEALGIFQFKDENLLTLMRALAIVLQLGNLKFDHDPASVAQESSVIASKDELKLLAELSGTSSQDWEASLTSKVLKTRGQESIIVRLSPQVAKESCDAFAKEIYSRLFELLVGRINEYTTCPETQLTNVGHISLLDIFGFERFDINRFEQLCINYANERLHFKYVLDNFTQVKDEYENEGIDLYDFRLVDNSEIVQLFEGTPGLLVTLNEECLRPNGNAESYVYKVKHVHGSSIRLIDRKLHTRTEFGIRHFAGSVEYETSSFVERNMDKLPDGLLDIASKISNDLIQEEFQAVFSSSTPEIQNRNTAPQKVKTNRTVLHKFQRQLKELMSAMEGTRTRYIRCIKPNSTMTPRKTNHRSTMQQLECSGLMTALVISRESFPNKLTYEYILTRYACLMTEGEAAATGAESKEGVERVLARWLKPLSKKNRDGKRTMPFACGKTKVFFKAGAQDHLEEMRSQHFAGSASKIQSQVRRFLAMKMLLQAIESICSLQSAARMMLCRQEFLQKRQFATYITAWMRGRWAVALLNDLRHQRNEKAATKIQSQVRCFSAKCSFHVKRLSATIISAWIRGRWAVMQLQDLIRQKRDRSATQIEAQVRCYFEKRVFHRKRIAAIVIAAWIRGQLARMLLLALRLHCMEEAAAVKIQSQYRCYSRMRLLKRARDAATLSAEHNAAATKIQSQARCFCAKRSFKQHREAVYLIVTQIEAAVKIQCQVRSYSSKRRAQRMKDATKMIAERNDRAATKMQAQFRSHVAKREFLLARKAAAFSRVQTAAATTIQSLFRSYSARCQRQRSLAAVTLLQREMRCWTNRRFILQKLHVLAERGRQERQMANLTSEAEQKAEQEQDQLEEMIRRLRTDVAGLKDENQELKDHLESMQGERRELETKAATSEAQFQTFKGRMDELATANDKLVQDILGYRSEISKLKRVYETNRANAMAKLDASEKRFAEASDQHEIEIQALSKRLEETQRKANIEKKALENQVLLLSDKNAIECQKLRDKLRMAQENHQLYLKTLSEVLENTHSVRAKEMEHILAELDSIRLEKDEQIEKLQQELKAYKLAMKVRKTSVRKKVNVYTLRDELRALSKPRTHQRTAQFDAVVRNLQSLVAESCALPSCVEDHEMPLILKQQERGQNMVEMIERLSYLYRCAESR